MANVDPGAEVGPAAYGPAYGPKFRVIQPTAPRAAFGPGYRESRHMMERKQRDKEDQALSQRQLREEYVQDMYKTEDYLAKQVGLQHSRDWRGEEKRIGTVNEQMLKHARNQAPLYSFAPPPHTARTVSRAPQKGPEYFERISFMSQDHRGVRIDHATAAFGPDEYSPVHENGKALAPRAIFGKADRFRGADGSAKEYISAEHCKLNYGQVGPGPMMYLHKSRDMGYTGGKMPRPSGLNTWVP